jgi:hypothetical protein
VIGISRLHGLVPEQLGEDAEGRASAKARKNYAGTSPITREPGNKKAVLARFLPNDQLPSRAHGSTTSR